MATGITISILQQYFSRLIAKFLNCTSDLLIRHDRGGKIVIFRQWQPGAAWNAKSKDWLDLRVTIVGALLLSSAAEQLCSELLRQLPQSTNHVVAPRILPFANLLYLTLQLSHSSLSQPFISQFVVHWDLGNEMVTQKEIILCLYFRALEVYFLF